MMNDQFVKVYYDSEFTGLNSNTELISIGLVSEYGNFFYAEFMDYDKTKITPWIKDNVVNNLVFNNIDDFSIIYPESDNLFSIQMKGSNEFVKEKLLEWFHSMTNDNKIQIYSDCYAYDWMLFNNLLADNGDALNLDSAIYYIPMDLSTTLQLYDIDPDITREEFIGENKLKQISLSYPFIKWGENIKHNSLWDAFVCKSCFEKIQ